MDTNTDKIGFKYIPNIFLVTSYLSDMSDTIFFH